MGHGSRRSIFNSFTRMKTLLATLTLTAFLPLAARCAEPEPIRLWPNDTPGEKGGIGAEVDTTKPTDGLVGGKRLMRIANVATPTMSIFPPPKDKDTGTAVVICPGGAYNILAWDLEGTEVCDWLNSLGVTGVVVKYRVPRREGLEKHTAPLQDAQRALGLVRLRAKELGINPERIGVLGFSAGGHLAAALSTGFDARTYEPLDDADKTSCRPDFTILIYPAYLTLKDGGDTLAPEIKVTAQTPPAFIAMAQDDPVHVESAYVYSLALKNAKVPCELHLYPDGGHGYGLRPSAPAVTTWPARAAEWMEKRGLLKKQLGL